MIKTNRSLEDAKKYILALRGKDLDVQVNLGRNKCAYYQGKLTAVYPALFTVKPFKSKHFKGLKKLFCFNFAFSYLYATA